MSSGCPTHSTHTTQSPDKDRGRGGLDGGLLERLINDADKVPFWAAFFIQYWQFIQVHVNKQPRLGYLMFTDRRNSIIQSQLSFQSIFSKSRSCFACKQTQSGKYNKIIVKFWSCALETCSQKKEHVCFVATIWNVHRAAEERFWRILSQTDWVKRKHQLHRNNLLQINGTKSDSKFSHLSKTDTLWFYLNNLPTTDALWFHLL